MTHRIGLIFHGIGEPARQIDKAEQRYWIAIDRFRRILDRVGQTSARYYLSFDDGNESDIAIGLPALVAHGLSADFFILTGRLGQAGSLREDQVRALAAAGMGVGSHGVAHLDWKRLDQPALEQDIAQSRSRLESILGRRVDMAAIPFGSYDDRTLKTLKAAGYKRVYSSDGGVMSDHDFPAGRTSIRADMTDAEIDALLDGRQSAAKRVRRIISKLLK